MKEASKTAMTAVVLAVIGLVIFGLGLWGASFELTRHLAPSSSEAMLAAQQRAADWTMIAAIVAAVSLPFTAAGILFVYLNLREAAAVSRTAAETLEETRKSRVAELRAYLLIESGVVSVTNGIPHFQIQIRNAGKTPAQNCEIARRILVTFEGDISRPTRPTLLLPNIGPSQSITHGSRLSVGRSAELIAATERAGRESLMALSGTLTYKDVFGASRTTTFRLKVPFLDGKFIDGDLVAEGFPNWSS